MLLALQNHIYEYDLKKNKISLEIELPDETKERKNVFIVIKNKDCTFLLR